MTPLVLLLTALSLSADCFAVAVSGAIAMTSPSRAQVIRTALVFGLAQFLMAVAGWAAGSEFVELVSSYDHWIAFGLLGLVGAHMIREAFEDEEERESAVDITLGVRLLILALSLIHI